MIWILRAQAECLWQDREREEAWATILRAHRIAQAFRLDHPLLKIQRQWQGRPGSTMKLFSGPKGAFPRALE